MSTIDHSLTYKQIKFKNIPHKMRLDKIFSVLEKNSKGGYKNYIDVGCSNGYITNIVKKKFNIERVTGKDFDEENLEIARGNYPDIPFEQIDLNIPVPAENYQYDLVTCFETLEHVGNPEEAVKNLLKLKGASGTLLITVPIEIGFWGILKFVLKRTFYNFYSLKELGDVKPNDYFFSLLRGKDMSVYRNPEKAGWGTHFGFDYRVVDKALKSQNIKFRAQNALTTRFYLVASNS